MLRNLKRLFLGLALALACTTSCWAQLCTGRLFNPLTDTDWNNLFPITVMGVRMGGNVNPPLMYEPPVCVCPGIFGIPSPGIGATFWQPIYVAEIERTPGCMRSLGGIEILPGYQSLMSEQNHDPSERGEVQTRMQMHWYEYPIFAVLDLFKSLACFSPSGFDLAYLTEIDPLWQDDLWSAVFAPESALFANIVAQAACTVDAIASNAEFPIDAMFWCAGSWGGVYPLTGNANISKTNFQLNHLVLAKFLARQARFGLQWETIGPTATCFAHPNPIWLKSQYRYNQVWPLPRKGIPLVTGSLGLTQMPPVTNLPTMESTVDLIWQAQQCCIRAY